MNKIKVLHIGKYYDPYIGGTEVHLSTLVNELKKRTDLEIDILVSNTRNKTVIERNNGFKIIRLATLGQLLSQPLSLSMPFWLRRQEADILHFHLPNPLSIFCYFLIRPKGKIVVSYHSDIIRQRFFIPLFKSFLVKFLKKASYIIATSDNLIKNSYILNDFQHKCKVIPCGIDINQFNPDEEVSKKAKEIRHSYAGPIILFVGRLVYYKGLEYLLSAMQNIKAKLLIIGAGPLKKRLQKQAKQLKVEDKIFWIGEIENKKLAPYYYACDVFVLPSGIRAESFGIVQLEAFACQKPVVSTGLPTGVTFVNQDGKTGLIVPPKNSSALACAINKLLASPVLRNHYGQNAKERVQKEFAKEKMAQEVLKVYKEVLNNKEWSIADSLVT